MGGGSVDLGTINPSNATFGTLNTVGFASIANLAGSSFTLNISQTSPTVNSGSLQGTLSGRVVLNASNAFLSFANPTLVLGPVTYEIFQATTSSGMQGIAIVPPSTHPDGTITGGTTTIQGRISAPSIPNDTTTPEPGTLGLIGLGLAAVGFVGRLRRA